VKSSPFVDISPDNSAHGPAAVHSQSSCKGVVFGLAHGYYGKVMVVIMVQGWLLGLFAYWRKSLRPGMLAHGLQDAIGGLVAFFS
jgi:hypothetical protein